MARGGDRDFVGYGANPPNPNWPNPNGSGSNGARLALNFVINFEEGSEPSIGDGESATETGLTESGIADFAPGQRDLGGESMFEYGSRVGFWRLFRLFQERGLPVTIFACALAIERNPAAAQAIRDANWDICCHGWRWIEHWKLSPETEREHIRKAVASLERTLGKRPEGWYCRYAPSENTRRLLVEEGGFLYDSDAYNDELPYWTKVDGKDHLIVPYTLTNNDLKFAKGNFATGEDFFSFCKDAFDVLYHEGAMHPKMMSVGLHMRLVGHPARAAALARFLDYVGGFPDVWICGRADIARHWRDHHPAPTPAGAS
ncbi:allantoinase PuuE [Fodinicurvata sp. EGI_FJ10296]|uniref:allantoinase PuuE n=1 Tax=Fodinicurvata sp. EGI_FJ10296 TaxID=3231908 RepID=UPI003451AAAB